MQWKKAVPATLLGAVVALTVLVPEVSGQQAVGQVRMFPALCGERKVLREELNKRFPEQVLIAVSERGLPCKLDLEVRKQPGNSFLILEWYEDTLCVLAVGEGLKLNPALSKPQTSPSPPIPEDSELAMR